MDDASPPVTEGATPAPNGWDAFVSQNSGQPTTPAPQTTQQPQQPANPKWDDFVRSHIDFDQMSSDQLDHITTALGYNKPAPPAPPDETLSNDQKAFQNSKGFQEGAAVFSKLTFDAVIAPAIKGYIENIQGPYRQQVGMANQQLVAAPKELMAGIKGLGEPIQPGEEIVSALAGKLLAPVTGALAEATAPLSEVAARTGLSGAIQGVIPEKAFGGKEGAAQLAQGIALIPFMVEGAMRPIPMNMARMKAAGGFDGEDVFMGTKEPTPEQAAGIDAAKAALHPETPAEPAFDIHAAARNVAPETFDKYDRLAATKETLGAQLNDLSEARTADLDAQIKEIQEAKQGGYGKLQSLIAERDELAASPDTPEMADIRQKIQENDYAMRDLAPEVSQAYRTAGEFAPPEPMPEAVQPPEKLAVESPASGEQKPIEEQRQFIIGDISQKLTALGRPAEEADAAAQLEAARYQTLAEQYPKFSAEEWYNRESANIKAGKERAWQLAQDKGIELNQPVYHGSPHRFDKFDLSKVGTGEGAQSYGWGQYFAESKSVAESYRRNLTGAADKGSFVWKGERIPDENIKDPVRHAVALTYHQGVKVARDIAKQGLEDAKNSEPYALEMGGVDYYKKMLDTAKEIKSAKEIKKDLGQLYEAHVPDEDVPRMLDWDKSLNQQSTYVREALKKIGFDVNDKDLNGEDIYNAIAKKYAAKEPEKSWETISIDTDKTPWSGHKKASFALADIGIPGIRYLDQSSRRSGEGTRNYVVFDQKLLDKMNEQVNTFYQPARGKIRLATDDAKATITLMKNANASTLIHEKGHEWTDQLLRLSAEDDAPAQLKADAETLRKYGGATEDGVIPTRGHEKIARGFERYLMEGTAPSRALAGVFAKFKTWLTSIYKTVEALRSPISNDIRDVFDRFLSANPEKTTIAPDHEPGAMLANIHEADARTTPPEHAADVADNVRSEIKSIAKQHDPEAEHAIATAEKTGASAGNQPSIEPTPVNTSAPEPATVGAGGGATTPEGGAVREPEPTATAGESTAGEQPGKPTARTATGPSPTGAGTVAKNAGEIPAEEKPGIPTNPTETLGRQKPYYVNNKGVINFDLFKTPEDIQKYLQEWADQHPDKISEARGGVVTLDQTMKLAQSMGLTVDDLKARKVGELYDGPKQVAAAQLFIQSSQRIKEAADAARASGDPEKIAKFLNDLDDHKDFMDMFLQQVGISAEASRALGARRAIRKLTGFNEAMQMGERIDDLFQRMTGANLKDAKVQADLFASLDTPEKISKMAQKTREADWFDYAIAYRNNNLLSGPVTHLHYADGNMLNIVYKPIKTAAASVIPGGPELGEAKAMTASMTMGAIKGWQAAKAAWQDGTDRSFQTMVENYKRPTKVIFNPTFDKYLGKGSPVGKSIGSIHTFFYTMNYEQELARYNFRQALGEGLTEGTDAFNNRMSDLQVNPSKETLSLASDASKRSVYMENPEYGTTMFNITQWANRSPAGRFLFPFAKMELNVKIQGLLDNTVLGLFSKDVRANLSGVNGSEARAIQIAGMTLGTSIAGSVFAMGDHINGNGPSDTNARKVWLLTHTPNSIQIGDVSIPLRALGNVGQVLMAGAELKEAYHEMTEDEAKNTAATFMEHVTRVAFQGTFIQNMSDTINAWEHPVQYGSQFLQNTAEGFVPYTTLLAQTNRYIDPFQREIHSQGLENLYGVTDYAKSRIPFASQTLQPRVDVLGNPIPNDKGLAAGSYNRYAADPVIQKLTSLGIGISKPKRDIMGVPLTDQQYHDYSVTSGMLIKQNLDWMLQNPSFDQMSHPAKVKEISRAIGEARKSAGQEVMFNNPEIMAQAVAKKEMAESQQ